MHVVIGSAFVMAIFGILIFGSRRTLIRLGIILGIPMVIFIGVALYPDQTANLHRKDLTENELINQRAIKEFCATHPHWDPKTAKIPNDGNRIDPDELWALTAQVPFKCY